MKKIRHLSPDFEMEITIPVYIHLHNFMPSRPAPTCSNPDSPLYSDSGNGSEYEDISIGAYVDGKYIELPEELVEYISKKYNEEIDEKADENIRSSEEHKRYIKVSKMKYKRKYS